MNLKPAFLLLGLCHAASAAALGLGDISLQSHLGQPLHATVTLLGASAETTANCFSLEASEDGIAPPPRAQLNIEQSGGQALLHIRTLQPVNDPVAQFVLVSDCEVSLRRDYVVLLDPPVLVTAAVSQDVPAAVTPTTAAPLATPAPRASRPQRKTQRTAAASRPSAARAPRPAAAPLAQAGTAPRLVLSGKRSIPQPADAPAAQHPDTHLPDLARPQPASLTATELSDENTALSRKLAHLETQLAALQQRYAELETRQAATPVTVAPPPEQPAQWPLYLLITGLLTTGIALVTWLLRRNRPRQPSILMDGIARSDAMPMTLSDISAWPEAEPLLAPQRMPEIAPPPPHSEGTEVKEDILDQAEVFMAHGHGDLAIHLLQEHLREAPTESPVPWLLLLDLLHRGGETEGYATASAECRRYFNINLTGHPISQDNETGEGLEAYPHLLEQLVNVWNTPEITAFFHDLIYDDRGGTRVGFEPGAYRDILLLREIAQEVLPLAA